MSLKKFLVYDQMSLSIRKETMQLDAETLKGVLDIHSKQDLLIQSIEFEFYEDYKRGWWRNKKTDRYVLAKKDYKVEIKLNSDNDYSFKFSMDYKKLKSKIEESSNSFVGDQLVKGLKVLGNVYSEYELIVKVKIKGSPLKIIHKQTLEL